MPKSRRKSRKKSRRKRAPDRLAKLALDSLPLEVYKHPFKYVPDQLAEHIYVYYQTQLIKKQVNRDLCFKTMQFVLQQQDELLTLEKSWNERFSRQSETFVWDAYVKLSDLESVYEEKIYEEDAEEDIFKPYWVMYWIEQLGRKNKEDQRKFLKRNLKDYPMKGDVDINSVSLIESPYNVFNLITMYNFLMENIKLQAFIDRGY